MSGTQFQLNFVNGSNSAGTACVYQDAGNVSANQADSAALAWMLAGANQSTVVQFIWTVDYNFAWFNYSTPRSYSVINAALGSADSVEFDNNSFGYYFHVPPTAAGGSSLLIQSSSTIPVTNSAVVGIGMSDAGTFAASAHPNLNYVFTPAADADLVYWISFGGYTFQIGDPVPLASLNPSGQVQFPAGVNVMTAALNTSNQWNIYAGLPAGPDAAIAARSTTLIYRPGKGTIPHRGP